MTIPLLLEHNRVLLDELNIGRRKVPVWVDTGNPDLLLSEHLARALGLNLSAQPVNGRIEVAPPHEAAVGGMRLSLDGIKTYVITGRRWFAPGTHVEANLPSTVLKSYHVVIDYPARRFSISLPGTVRPRGTRVACAVHPQTGLIRIGDYALDAGASYSFASADVLAEVSKHHPAWPRRTGALGAANMWGMPGEPEFLLVRLGALQWGPLELRHAGMAGLSKDIIAWYSQKTPGPVKGLIGGNVLKSFRVEIDYAAGAVYFEKRGALDAHDMDLAGLALQPATDGGFTVSAVADIPGVEQGDRLLRVDKLEAIGATMGQVVDALRGRPGDTRTLLLERAGRQFTIRAKVKRFL